MMIKDLKQNKKNPRKISKKKLEMLRKSLEKLGDLSGFVYNVRSKQLVGGHQRSKSLPQNSRIVLETRHAQATRAGTVAEGYVDVGGERFKYREVDWDEKTETEALLAANQHGGEWDADLLKIVLADMPSLDIEIAGFEPMELTQFGYKDTQKGYESQAETDEKSDEQYVKENPGPESNIQKEVIGENPFEKVEEKAMDVVGRRFVIIIDCTSQEHKDALKEKISEVVKEAGGKFF